MAMARVSSTPAQLTVVVADVFPSMPASQFSAPGEFPDKIHHHATPFAIVNSREAFKKLPAATLAHLLDPANIKELDAVLEYHAISGSAIYSKDLKTFQLVKTLEVDTMQSNKISKAKVSYVYRATNWKLNP